MGDRFYKNVKNQCIEKNISVNKLEKELHLPRGFIFKTKNHAPSVDRAATIANYLGTTVDALLAEASEE